MSDHCCSEEVRVHESSWTEKYRDYFLPVISSVLLLAGIFMDYRLPGSFQPPWDILLYGTAYFLIGWPVLKKAFQKLFTRDIFNEFFLMSLATIGAFAIGQYPEGVAVMLFYTIGEIFQDAAVGRAKRSIEALLKLQVEEVTWLEEEKRVVGHPREVVPGQVILVRPGEKVALDGKLLSAEGSFNTAALTGESVPDRKVRGEAILAGMINLHSVVEIKVTSLYENTRLSKILKLVQEATKRKAKTQRFITRFAGIYTPIVVFLALALTLLPYFFVETYHFNVWFYRALIFLVIACPCALVISIPLGYFGGIGAASHHGILFKGSNFLDLMSKIDTVVLDKTGTLTKGDFRVQEVFSERLNKVDLMNLVVSLERNSTHPIAQAIVNHGKASRQYWDTSEVQEIPGQGIKGKTRNHQVVVGNQKMMETFRIPVPEKVNQLDEGAVIISVDGRYEGYLLIRDLLKDDARLAIDRLRDASVREIIILSGDKQQVVDHVAGQLGIDIAYGKLLPAEKVRKVEELQKAGRKVAFAGDGINDAPVIAVADVGIAMGGLGSDVAIETADVVIQTDHPSRIATAIDISKATHRIVWQNISLAFGVKLIVLAMGAGGLATMWEAVFADVGVALMAIFNAVRIQKMEFH